MKINKQAIKRKKERKKVKQTSWTGLLWSFGFTNSVTPNFLAVFRKYICIYIVMSDKPMIKESWIVKILDFYLCCFSSYLPSSNLLGFKSTPMIREAPEIRAPSAAWNMRINSYHFNQQIKKIKKNQILQQGQQLPIQKQQRLIPLLVLQHLKLHQDLFFYIYIYVDRHKNKIKLLDSLCP